MKGLLVAFCVFVASATTASAGEPAAAHDAGMDEMLLTVKTTTIAAQEAHLNMLVS